MRFAAVPMFPLPEVRETMVRKPEKSEVPALRVILPEPFALATSDGKRGPLLRKTMLSSAMLPLLVVVKIAELVVSAPAIVMLPALVNEKVAP